MDTLKTLFGLDGRVALVTGSSAGIGRALAGGLARAGARVVVNGRDADKVAATVAALTAEGLAAQAAVFDVTDEAAVEAGVAAIEAEVGAIDILVNNAGMQYRGALETYPTEAFDRLMATNVRSVFLVGRAVAQRMIPRRRGQIINIASVQSELARKGIAPYTATKGAVKNLTKGMATDWGPHGLTVNAIAPGYFKTELNQALWTTPTSRPGSPGARRSDAGARWRNWSAPPSIWPRRRPRSSTATRSSSTED